jgi:hypothetical protein
MLVARRDPFHPGAHDAPFTEDAAGGTPRLARTVGMLQVIGSLLAIPVGLGSAYSIYRANFSAETTCQSLRADIISMIDKRLDASTRRILVGRDVERFEQTCGSIDPQATAAFKTLLSNDKPATAAAAPVAAPAVHVVAKPQEAVAKAEPRPRTAGKMPDVAWPGAERAHREAGVSDTQWLDAVRQALVTHEASAAAAEAIKVPVVPAAVVPATPPVLRPALREAAAPANEPVAAAPAPVQAAPPMAPALPPAALVAAPAAVAAEPPAPKADADHPVPPDAIPDPAEVAAAEANDHRSRVRRWIAKIPLMGNVIDNGLP